jgi:hypothetical protein
MTHGTDPVAHVIDREEDDVRAVYCRCGTREQERGNDKRYQSDQHSLA